MSSVPSWAAIAFITGFLREQIERQCVQLAGSTPEELGSFIRQQPDAWGWGRAFREAGMKPE